MNKEANYHEFKHDNDKRRPLEELEYIRLAAHGDTVDALRFERVGYIGSKRALPREHFPSHFWQGLFSFINLRSRTLGIGEAMRYGEAKYGRWDSWLDAVPDAVERYQNAALRHFLWRMYYPEDLDGIDLESRLKHDSLAACNIAFVVELMERNRRASR